MKIWILKPIDYKADPWVPSYGKAFGFVFRAETEQAARELATKGGQYEIQKFPDCWIDPKLTSCVSLTAKRQNSYGRYSVRMKD